MSFFSPSKNIDPFGNYLSACVFSPAKQCCCGRDAGGHRVNLTVWLVTGLIPVKEHRYLLLWAGSIVVVAVGAVLGILLSLFSDNMQLHHRTELYASLGLLALLVVGLFLFYRLMASILHATEAREARYRTLFESTTDGVLLMGPGIEECNDRACQLFRCRREDILGLPWRDFFRRYAGDEDALQRFKMHVRAGRAGDPAPFPWTFRPVGAPPLMAEVAMRPVRDGDNSLMLVSIRDVTAREESERVLQAAEQALRGARDRFAQADRYSALVELAAGIAHEVNQPLAAIASYAQACRRLLADGGSSTCPDDVRVALDRIAIQAQRAGESIHRVLALVPRVPDNAADPACINQLIVEVMDLMREEIDRLGASVLLDLGEVNQPVRADPLQLQRVVMQLLRNALEAMVDLPQPVRQVRISTRLDGDVVEVVIADQGHGIAADDRARLFTPFYSTRKKGMGMGLAISLSIIRSYHGELDVDDQYTAGARFFFRLPTDSTASWSDASCRDKVVL